MAGGREREISQLSNKIRYHARIQPATIEAFYEMCKQLGFHVWRGGRYYGDPSIGDMLDALAEAYRADPTAVVERLKISGVEGKGKPPLRD